MARGVWPAVEADERAPARGGTYYIWTIGCQMNAADSLRLAEELEARGFRKVTRPEEADLVVLNTCVVRASAENKALGRLSSLRPLKERWPQKTLAVAGCLVGDVAELQRRFPWVDLFLPPSQWGPLLARLGPRPAEAEGLPQWPVSVHVPIAYGCDHLCTYCIVRLRRGPLRSRPISEVQEEVTHVVARGAREVVLLGQNVDAYGQDLEDGTDLARLLHAVHPTQGLWRIRFLTSHPADMQEDLIQAVAALPKVCEHFELPVQSGSNAVLRRMVRRYTVEDYKRLVEAIREQVPGAALATDVIVGFPGETVTEFEETLRLLQEVRFDVVHVAAYSPRPGTAAARLPDDVPPEEKERRRRAVEELQEEIAREINQRLVGQVVEVLVEDRHRGKWRGRTRTNKLVFLSDARDLRGRLVSARITWAGPWSMQGEVVG
ncbi:MAG: MiaB/RimO family radical SAM methylthiotransferase [Anaerolineae bacterium]|nr:MiaB/RimO family radical SAM methylthiotransferase [Anaerolineae bacterium]